MDYAPLTKNDIHELFNHTYRVEPDEVTATSSGIEGRVWKSNVPELSVPNLVVRKLVYVNALKREDVEYMEPDFLLRPTRLLVHLHGRNKSTYSFLFVEMAFLL